MRLSLLIDSTDLCGSQRAQPPAQEWLQLRPMGGQLFSTSWVCVSQPLSCPSLNFGPALRTVC